MLDTHQTQIYTAVLITCVVVGTVIFYFAISLIRQQKRTLELQRLNVLTEINTLEKERTRIAKDLHDDLGPSLTHIKFQVVSAEAIDEEDQELLRNAGLQLDEMVQKVREIAHNMMPSVLTRKGLTTALNEYIESVNDSTPLKITYTHDIHTELSQEKNINIYRVLLEVIQNTLKHSKADQFLMNIKEEKGKLVILCEDNGVGFDYQSQLASQKGIGLRNFRSRVEIMGGRLQAASQPGKGTQYIFTIPIND
jgi:two-component system NarL family sensor kinase